MPIHRALLQACLKGHNAQRWKKVREKNFGKEKPKQIEQPAAPPTAQNSRNRPSLPGRPKPVSLEVPKAPSEFDTDDADDDDDS